MDAAALIKKHEGLSLKVYEDNGHSAAGYGHDFLPGEAPPIGTTVTIDQCETWFQNDFNSAQANAKADVPCFDQLNEARQAVLIDMAYELGRGGLAAFHNFIRALTMCAWSEAALQMKASKWATQVPEREAEDATIMLTGEFPC